MDVILNVISVLGLGAFLIAAWVFGSAAKRYVSGENLLEEMAALESDLSPYRHWKDRADSDRRRPGQSNVFPMMIRGVVITEDRRRRGDRRSAA